MKNILLFITALWLLFACADKNAGAQIFMDEAKALYSEKKYDEAKQRLDTMQKVYPKALAQIKEGVILLKEIRIAKNKSQIALCDSLLVLEEAKVEALKKNFTFVQNKEYQEKGFYVPRGTVMAATQTQLRSGVTENGELFLESVYVGGGIHNQIALKTKSGKAVESLPVTGDGLNFRFSNLGVQYEIIKFTQAAENGVAQFIKDNQTEPISLTLKGKNTYSYTLSAIQKKNISLAADFSNIMLKVDSLKSEKEKSAILLNSVLGK